MGFRTLKILHAIFDYWYEFEKIGVLSKPMDAILVFAQLPREGGGSGS